LGGSSDVRSTEYPHAHSVVLCATCRQGHVIDNDFRAGRKPTFRRHPGQQRRHCVVAHHYKPCLTSHMASTTRPVPTTMPAANATDSAFHGTQCSSRSVIALLLCDLATSWCSVVPHAQVARNNVRNSGNRMSHNHRPRVNGRKSGTCAACLKLRCHDVMTTMAESPGSLSKNGPCEPSLSHWFSTNASVPTHTCQFVPDTSVTPGWLASRPGRRRCHGECLDMDERLRFIARLLAGETMSGR
jgi:hypothetical protein